MFLYQHIYLFLNICLINKLFNVLYELTCLLIKDFLKKLPLKNQAL